MVPTLHTALGIKGHRLEVGTSDCKDKVHVFASLNVIDGKLITRIVEDLKNAVKKTGKSKCRRLQEAFAKHLRDVAKAYPKELGKTVTLTIDNAPWHRGKIIDEVLAEFPHLKLYRLPSYSPQLNLVERFWKKLRRRATHNRYFSIIALLKKALRGSLQYFQTLKHKVLSLIDGPRKKTKLPAA